MIVLEWLMRDFADVTYTSTPNTLVPLLAKYKINVNLQCQDLQFLIHSIYCEDPSTLPLLIATHMQN